MSRYQDRTHGQSNLALAADTEGSPGDLDGDVAFAAMLSGTHQAGCLRSGTSRHIIEDLTHLVTLERSSRVWRHWSVVDAQGNNMLSFTL